MTFERTQDVALIRSILSDPSQFPTLAEEQGEQVFERIAHEAICIVAQEYGPVALFLLYPRNAALCEVHIGVLQACWGAKGRWLAKRFLHWFWDRYEFHRLVANIEAGNKLAIKYAERAGMSQFGFNEKSMIKHGKLCDVTMLGISRPEDQ